MWGISYWTLPLLSSLVWLAMLLAMLITWLTEGSPHYPSMDPTQHIAYISDIGAQGLKPLFIAMGTVTVVVLDLSFLSERWLRHTGRLAHNTSWSQKGLSIASIIAAIVGAVGLILLTIFDTLRHPHAHDVFLVLFIAGYIVSAIFICIEYLLLGIQYRDHSILKISFYIKLTFIVVEVVLAIAFGVMQNQSHYNVAAVLEWVIALIFTFYVFSFFMDFIPAVRTKHHQSRETEVEMAMDGGESQRGLQDDHHGSRYYGNGTTNSPVNGMTNGMTNGTTNGHGNGAANGHVKRGTHGTNGYVAPGHPNTSGIHDDTYYPDGHPRPVMPVGTSSNF